MMKSKKWLLGVFILMTTILFLLPKEILASENGYSENEKENSKYYTMEKINERLDEAGEERLSSYKDGTLIQYGFPEKFVEGLLENSKWIEGQKKPTSAKDVKVEDLENIQVLDLSDPIISEIVGDAIDKTYYELKKTGAEYSLTEMRNTSRNTPQLTFSEGLQSDNNKLGSFPFFNRIVSLIHSAENASEINLNGLLSRANTKISHKALLSLLDFNTFNLKMDRLNLGSNLIGKDNMGIINSNDAAFLKVIAPFNENGVNKRFPLSYLDLSNNYLKEISIQKPALSQESLENPLSNITSFKSGFYIANYREGVNFSNNFQLLSKLENTQTPSSGDIELLNILVAMRQTKGIYQFDMEVVNRAINLGLKSSNVYTLISDDSLLRYIDQLSINTLQNILAFSGAALANSRENTEWKNEFADSTIYALGGKFDRDAGIGANKGQPYSEISKRNVVYSIIGDLNKKEPPRSKFLANLVEKRPDLIIELKKQGEEKLPYIKYEHRKELNSSLAVLKSFMKVFNNDSLDEGDLGKMEYQAKTSKVLVEIVRKNIKPSDPSQLQFAESVRADYNFHSGLMLPDSNGNSQYTNVKSETLRRPISYLSINNKKVYLSASIEFNQSSNENVKIEDSQ